MRESLCYHHLFSFSSPSGAVRSQTRYHSPPAPPTGTHNTAQRKWNKRIKDKGKQNGWLPDSDTSAVSD